MKIARPTLLVLLLITVAVLAAVPAMGDTIIDPVLSIGTSTGSPTYTFTTTTTSFSGITMTGNPAHVYFQNGAAAGNVIVQLVATVTAYSGLGSGTVVFNCSASNFFTTCAPSQAKDPPGPLPISFTFSGGSGVGSGSYFSLDASGLGSGGSLTWDFDATYGQVQTGSVTNNVPEPASLLLFAGGLSGLAALLRRKRS